jgi:hypothetical protein
MVYFGGTEFSGMVQPVSFLKLTPSIHAGLRAFLFFLFIQARFAPGDVSQVARPTDF